jgi:hypothetical protein
MTHCYNVAKDVKHQNCDIMLNVSTLDQNRPND